MKTALILALLSITPIIAGEPVRLASEARVWLKVGESSDPLRDFSISRGNVTQAGWESNPTARERLLDFTFPIRWWRWTEVEIHFTPASDGDVEFSLLGPWGGTSDGGVFRQEVLWDKLEATGAALTNGGFESNGQMAPAGWSSPWSPYPNADTWPLREARALEGSKVAASWNNRPLTQLLRVHAGKSVTLKLHAKSATTPDFVQPAVLGGDTPAHREAARLKRGVNLGNGWESPPNSWGLRFTTEDIDHIADQGFDHVRIPIAWHFHLTSDPDGTVISPEFLAQLEPVVKRALDRRLAVLINWHHFEELTKTPDATLDRFVSGWEAIARHFQSWPPGLFFELLNEPCENLTTEKCNLVYPKVLAAIRRTNPERMIVVSPGQWGSVGELDRLRLPGGDDRLIVTLHCYEPFQFTHQGAGWVGYGDLRGITYPGPPANPFEVPASLREDAGIRAFIESYNRCPVETNPCSPLPVRLALDDALEWSRHFGRPVHLGEFGANNAGDDASRSRYLRDVRTLAEARRIPWTMWEWKAGFGYWDPVKKQPRFRSSLFD